MVVFLLGGFASSKLSAVLSNTFSVPGTASEQVRHTLQTHFGDRSDGSFTVVFALDNNASANHTRLRRNSRTTYSVSCPFSGCKPSIVKIKPSTCR